MNNATDKEWVRHIYKEAQARNSYRRPMSNGKNVEKRQNVLRRVKHPLESHLQTAPPQLSDAIEILCHQGRGIEGGILFREWCAVGTATFVELTGCAVIAEAGHCNTNNLHADKVYSRYSTDQKILALNGIGAGGPWFTAVDRLLRMGSKESELLDGWAKAVTKFQQRLSTRVRKQRIHGAIPVDIQVARKVDAWVDSRLTEMGFDVDSLKRSYLKRARGEKIDQLRREARDLELRSVLVAKAIKKLQEQEFQDRQQSFVFEEAQKNEFHTKRRAHEQRTDSKSNVTNTPGQTFPERLPAI